MISAASIRMADLGCSDRTTLTGLEGRDLSHMG
jgi:hypothetical protein